jgi:lysophospholipase L1-like esterase
VYLVAGAFGMRGLVVAVGTNDWALNGDLVQFRDSYAGLLAGLPPDVPVACLSPPWRESEASPNGNGNTLDEFRDVIHDVCTAAGGTYLDGKAAIPNAPAYFIDGLHPNARGHRAMARFLKAELGQLGWIP